MMKMKEGKEEQKRRKQKIEELIYNNSICVYVCV
jgi:hypothetical protein